jgi:hypothetical protein
MGQKTNDLEPGELARERRREAEDDEGGGPLGGHDVLEQVDRE